MLKPKTLAVLGLVMITVLGVTFFVSYSYADPVDRSTENQEYEERHNHHHSDGHYERHHQEELHNDPEESYNHHHDEIGEDRYYRYCCH